MTRVLVGLVLGMTLAAGWWATAADDAPKELTPEERKELETKWKEFMRACGRAYQAGDLPEAAAAAKKALATARQLYPRQGHPDVAGTLNDLAGVLHEQGKDADAEKFHREALEMRRRLYPKQDHPAVAASLDNLANGLQAQGKSAAAESLHREALAMYRRLYPKQDHPQLASSLNNLAVTLQEQGKYADAEKLYRELMEVRRRLYPKQDHPELALSLYKLASTLQAQGKDADAETFHREALAMLRRLYPEQDHPKLAWSLSKLALVLEAQQKYADAETFHREALAMFRRLAPEQGHPLLAQSLSNLALVLQAQGKDADAETSLREALAMRRRLYPRQDHPDLARNLASLAIILQKQGKDADAETPQREALALYRRLYAGQDHPDLAANLSILAVVLQKQSKYADAETLEREAVAMYRRLYPKQDHPKVAWSLNDLANVLWYQGKSVDAETLHREALAMTRRLYTQQDHPDLALSLNNLANVLHDQGKDADAEKLHRGALAMRRRLYARQDHPLLARGLYNLATVLLEQGKHADADTLYREALAMYRGLARDYAAVRSEGDTLTLAATHAPARDGFLSNARAAKAAAATVYPEVWASKAALGRIYEQRALAARAAATDPRAAALLGQLTDRRRRRADLLLSPTPSDPATARQRDADLSRFASEIQALDRELRPLLPALARTDKLAQATPADLQKVLPADAALVDFLRWTSFEQDPQVPGRKGEKQPGRYLAFVVTRDKVMWVDLGEAGPIEKAVTAWREAITAGQDIPPERPARVRELVWAKVRKELPERVKVVYLCPDLALCQVPWAALPGDKPGTVLLEEYAVATVPHAVFLLDKLWPQDATPKRPTDVLAVGGVAYDAAVPAPDKGAVHRGDPLLKPGQQPGWAVLPGAAAEVKGVTGAASKKDLVCRTLDKEEATTSAVLAALPKVRYAHLATHGFFADASFRSAFQLDPRLFDRTLRGERVGAGALSPMVMTGLVFAGANKPNTPGRGIVTGEALVDLDLSGLELVVLSACETGLGDVAGGEGTFGLQRAFHLAGTRDVVASLWKVPDRPTAALMALFYRNLWDKELPLVEALRQAQLEVYRHPEKIPELAAGFRGKFVEVAGTEEPPVMPGADGKAHPRLWAAFTLSGPGR
jgi:CHAT domain-containing protein